MKNIPVSIISYIYEWSFKITYITGNSIIILFSKFSFNESVMSNS